MLSGRPQPAPRRGFARHEWLIAAALGAACSVFPDQAVLPGGTGGSNSAGGSNSTGGGNSTGGSDSGGTDSMGGTTGSQLGGARATGGEGGDLAGSSGSPDAGGAAGGNADAGNAGQGGADASGGSPQTGGTGGAGCTTPTVLRFDATADTYLNEAKNQQSKNYGIETSLLVSGVTDARAHSLVNFDLSALATGRALTRATLRFVLVAPVVGARSLSLYRVGRPWQEDRATWARASTGPAVTWSVPGGDTALLPSNTVALSDAALAEHVDFDVRADLEALVQSSYYGWLVDAAPGDDTVQLASRQSLFADDRPTLIVELCP